MSRRTKIILAVVALLIVAGVVAAVALGQGGGGTEVETAAVQEEDLSVTVTASGRVESGVSADVYPPTTGIIESVNVDEGAVVKAGATLAVMDREPLVQSVLQAEAAVAAAQSQLAGIAKQVPSSADLAAASANTDAAWTSYEAAVDALDAVSDQAPSKGDIAAADAATNAAWTAYQTALTAYELLKKAIEASAAPAPQSLAELAQLKTAKDQAYAAYLQAASAEANLRAYDGTPATSQAYAAADQAYAAYLGAVAQENTLITTGFGAERDAAAAQLAQAQQALTLAMDTLAGAEMTAPIDGVVVFNAVGTPDAQGNAAVAEAGVAVAPGAAPFTVVDLDGVSFVAEVDEVDVGRLSLGMLGQVQLDAFPAQSFEATVTRIEEASQLTATGGTVFPVHLAFEETDEQILIGMQGDVGIEVSSVPSALTIPIEALFDEGGTSYVYVVEDDALARTEVEVGTLTETQVQILAGVSDGQTVALSGPTELVDGMAVTVAE